MSLFHYHRPYCRCTITVGTRSCWQSIAVQTRNTSYLRLSSRSFL
jgi:hypothetical protein